MRIFSATFLTVLFLATPAFADLPPMPCQAAAAGDACMTNDGAAGTCVDNNGVLSCEATVTNNGTNGATNNATTTPTNNATANASNNGTPGATNAATTPKTDTSSGTTEEKKGCATVGAGGLAPSLLAFALLFGLRRKR